VELKDLKKCTKCVLPETVAGISFDNKGVCSVCKNIKKKMKINFIERKGKLKKIFEKFKGKGKYDCLVPYSGGKDSAYVLYICKKYGMVPLAYNFNNHFQTRIGKDNMENIVRAVDVDLVTFAPEWKVVKKLCLKGLEKIGDFCWFCNSGVYATSIQRGIIEDVPLIVFGEHVVEYDPRFGFGDTYEKVYRESAQEGVPETEFIDDEIGIDNLKPYTLPLLELREKLSVIFLGDYIKWDKDEIIKILKKEVGWKEGEVKGASTTFEHIDCKFTGIRDYIKFLKRGYGRNAQLASIKIREGKITREEALKEAKRDGKEPINLNEFLETINLTKEEFIEIISKHKKY